MATDGVKIIDGDTASDTYWGIMDLYDSGADIEIIEKEYPLIQTEFFDDFENEIYVTSCALALWEIGQMTEEKLRYIKEIIEKDACVKEWSVDSEKKGSDRKKVLEKFWIKINRLNQKIRPRKKYRKIVNFYFQPNDLITFKLFNGNYGIVLCSSIDQYRGSCDYMFTQTTYDSPKKPTIEDIKNLEILCTNIGSGYDKEITKTVQPGIEKIWELENFPCNFFLGLVQLAAEHRDLANFKSQLEKLGTVTLLQSFKKTGAIGIAKNIQGFEEMLKHVEYKFSNFIYKKYPLVLLCEV